MTSAAGILSRLRFDPAAPRAVRSASHYGAEHILGAVVIPPDPWDAPWRRSLVRARAELMALGINPDGGGAVPPRRMALTGRDLVLYLADLAAEFNDRDRAFIQSASRFANPSEKQLKWCRDIVKRYRIEVG